MEHVEEIKADERLLAVVVRSAFKKPGCNFVTPLDFPFQLGFHVRQANEAIEPHSHVPFKELKDVYPQEFFYVEHGKLEVGVYNGKHKHMDVVLSKGDIIVLNCPHEMKFLEDSKVIELKQGPYRGRDVEKIYL